MPDELLEPILNFAMISRTPFDVNECVRAAKRKRFVDLTSTGWQTLDLSPAEYERRRRWDMFKMEEEEKKRRTQTTHNSGWHLPEFHYWPHDEYRYWGLYNSSIESQRPHLLDWRLAGSVCKRWRRMGKIAFWGQKVIAMDLAIAKEIQLSNMTYISKQDQQTAVKYIESVVLVPPPLSSPASFLTLPKCLTGFPSLRHVDFYFGQRWENRVGVLLKASQQRMQPPQHFFNLLSAIGVCTEKLDVGILIDPSTDWTSEEKQLWLYLYPLLIRWADVKCAEAKNKMRALQI